MRKKGFTIIEIMVSVAIVSVVSVGMLAIIVRSMHGYYTLSALNELNNNASLAADEITKDILESDISLITIASISDPATGESHDILVFPALNGIDVNGAPNWQNVIAYYPFRDALGIDQLRKYVYTDASLTNNDFPLSAIVTATAINLSKQDSTSLVSFNRAAGQQRVLANFISTVSYAPIASTDTVFINLFLQKPVIGIPGASTRDVSFTLNSAATLRN